MRNALIAAAVVTAGGGAIAIATRKPDPPPNALHLWAKQPDGGRLLREPLPTLDDGGCQSWAQRCADQKCKEICE